MKRTLLCIAMLWLVAMTSSAQIADTTEAVLSTIDLRRENFKPTYTAYLKATCGERLKGMNYRTNWILKATVLESKIRDDIHIIVFSKPFRNGKTEATVFKKIWILLSNGTTLEFNRYEIISKTMQSDFDAIVRDIYQMLW